ncbi:hypothetical protein [Palleronia abyssalis]|mgnify:CR=1 FL=1|uniref:Uncharacterized protein n=1 Tax=Palleronia abyssalis TaxID=1501240 RepID=A0A2R8BU15_9RHOB|nr:hypothetical protein [Palleronia abyssalis]SPJ23642.1 hypothetical protein PAA8504_01455 [Palleronia abyssalis]
MFRSVEAMVLTLVLVCAALSAEAGGLCGPLSGVACPTDSRPVAPVPNGTRSAGTDPQITVLTPGAPGAARIAYERSSTGLWRAAANGTCIGTLGAWHLTPYRIMAEGTVYEILSVAGDATLIDIVARRVFDEAPAEFSIAPRGRGRIDVVGGVIGGESRARYHDALYRCRKRPW